jgi:hypothetical protein
VRFRRPFLSTAIDFALALPVSVVIALVGEHAAGELRARGGGARVSGQPDRGMAFFFGLAAKEIVEATAPGGALHRWRRAAVWRCY